MRMPFLAACLLPMAACGSNRGETRETGVDTAITTNASKRHSIPGSNIVVEVIPHTSQRYNTVGDYWIDDNGVRQIRLSDLGDPYYEKLVLIHELVEITLNQKAGVTDAMVDEFDFAFEEDRAPNDESEPGDDPRAPYYEQHQFASKVEREMAEQLGVDWDAYGERVEEVMATYP